MLLPAFSPFPTMFSTHPIENFCFEVAFISSSANTFNLDQSKILLFGKEFNTWLTFYLMTKYKTYPN